jgi:hypothetical protein
MAMVRRHRRSIIIPRRLYNWVFLTIACVCIFLNITQYRLLHYTNYSNSGDTRAVSTASNRIRISHFAKVQAATKVQAANTKTPSFTHYNCSYSNHTFQLPTIPQFLIVGAQKSGTTALYEFLKEHPQIRGSIAPETHFFDWHFPKGPEEQRNFFRTHNLSPNVSSGELQCAIRKAYVDSFNVNLTGPVPPDTIFVEKTPSYLFLANTPERISTTCFWKPKVIVILRNPIDRAFSHYKMRIQVKGRSFETIIDEEMESLHKVGLSHAPRRTEQNFTLQDPRFDDLPKLSSEEQKQKHWRHYRKVGQWKQKALLFIYFALRYVTCIYTHQNIIIMTDVYNELFATGDVHNSTAALDGLLPVTRITLRDQL